MNFVNVCFGILFLIGLGKATECPVNFPEECRCVVYGDDIEVSCLARRLDEEFWNVTNTFENMADALGENPANIYYLTLTGYLGLENGIELPANAISRVNATQLNWFHHDKFLQPDLDAFPSLYTSVRRVYLRACQQHCPQNPMEFFRKFEKLEALSIEQSSYTVLPTHSVADASKLHTFDLFGGPLHTVQENAFSNVPMLRFVYLAFNNISAEGLSPNSFAGLAEGNYIYMYDNPNLLYLPQDVFEPMLLGDTNLVSIGSLTADPNYHLVCDERADWICEHVDTFMYSIFGYYCRNQEYVDVWHYCQENFGVSVNREEILRLQSNHAKDTKQRFEYPREHYRRS